MRRGTYKLLDSAVGYVVPALFVVSAGTAYGGDMDIAILSALWGCGAVLLFNRFELDQLRRESTVVFKNQRTLATIYGRMADELEEQAVRELKQEEK